MLIVLIQNPVGSQDPISVCVAGICADQLVFLRSHDVVAMVRDEVEGEELAGTSAVP